MSDYPYVDNNLGELGDHPYGNPKDHRAPKSLKILLAVEEIVFLVVIAAISFIPFALFGDPKEAFWPNVGVILATCIIADIWVYVRIKISKREEFLGIYAPNFYWPPLAVDGLLVILAIILLANNVFHSFSEMNKPLLCVSAKFLTDILFYAFTKGDNCPHCKGWQMKFFVHKGDEETSLSIGSHYGKEKVGEEATYHLDDGTVDRHDVYADVEKHTLNTDKRWKETYACAKCNRIWSQTFESHEEENID
jgi:hypothetical protein